MIQVLIVLVIESIQLTVTFVAMLWAFMASKINFVLVVSLHTLFMKFSSRVSVKLIVILVGFE